MDVVHIPKGIRIVHPFFALVFVSKAVKEFIYARIALSRSEIRFALAATFCFIKKQNWEFKVFN